MHFIFDRRLNGNFDLPIVIVAIARPDVLREPPGQNRTCMESTIMYLICSAVSPGVGWRNPDIRLSFNNSGTLTSCVVFELRARMLLNLTIRHMAGRNCMLANRCETVPYLSQAFFAPSGTHVPLFETRQQARLSKCSVRCAKLHRCVCTSSVKIHWCSEKCMADSWTARRHE